MVNPIISLKNITKIFKESGDTRLTVLKDIDLEIFPGEFFVFLGPSGSGKSTLLRIMSGLESDYEGKVKISEEISADDFSFVFQQFALMPWLSVYENVMLGVINKNLTAKEKDEIVKNEINFLGLRDFAKSYPKELSGGMRQRVGLARALAKDPKIIFMDEPFSELDSFTAENLRQEILRIWREKKPAVIMVTHLIDEALELADRIAVLSKGPAEIKKIIKNTLPRPRNKRSDDFYKLYDEIYGLIKI